MLVRQACVGWGRMAGIKYSVPKIGGCWRARGRAPSPGGGLFRVRGIAHRERMAIDYLVGRVHVDGGNLDRLVFGSNGYVGALHIIFRELTARRVNVDVGHLALLGFLNLA